MPIYIVIVHFRRSPPRFYRSKCNSRPLHEREKACFTRCERRRDFKTDQSMISRESLTHINEWYRERWAFAGRVTPPCCIYACQSRSFQEIADSFADRSENRSVPVRFISGEHFSNPFHNCCSTFVPILIRFSVLTRDSANRIFGFVHSWWIQEIVMFLWKIGTLYFSWLS